MTPPDENTDTDSTGLSTRDRNLLLMSVVIAAVVAVSSLRSGIEDPAALTMEIGLPLLIAVGLAYVLFRERE